MLWCGGNPISSRQIVESISILNFFPPNRCALLDTLLRRESNEGQKIKRDGTLTPGHTPENLAWRWRGKLSAARRTVSPRPRGTRPRTKRDITTTSIIIVNRHHHQSYAGELRHYLDVSLCLL
jgi:hypothetical protein